MRFLLLIQGESTKLTDQEVASAASIVAMTGGMFLLSDDMEKVSEARLSIAKRIFPLTGVTAVPLDLHSTVNSGMPCILRLWCTEYATSENFVKNATTNSLGGARRAEALRNTPPCRILSEQSSKLEYAIGCSPETIVDPYSRERSCFFVAPGLGTWTIVSLSNWLDHTTKLSVSFSALVCHSCHDFVAMESATGSNAVFTRGDSNTTENGASTPGELSEGGFHVFSFWSSKYAWIPHQVRKNALSCNLYFWTHSKFTTLFFAISPLDTG